MAAPKTDLVRCPHCGTDFTPPASTEVERLTEELRVVLGHVVDLRAEVEEWRCRWAAERRDHEATIAHCDKVMNEWPP